MKTVTSKIAWCITLATGALLVFIGARFFLVPKPAETAFGIHVNVDGNFSFHYIKGIRDMAVGLLTIVLLLTKELRALGWMMFCSTIIPVNDFLIVLNSPGHLTGSLFPHLIAVVICLLMGAHYLLFTAKKNKYAAL
jgi:hypothetical protein